MPGTPLPLNIFEERYRMMIHRCIETDEEFGVVLISGTQLRTVGCTAHVVQVLNEYDDGRFEIMAQGKRRFLVSDIHDELPYLEGTVHFFEDDPGSATSLSELTETAIDLFTRVSALARISLDPAFLRQLSPEELTFVLSGTCSIDVEERQSLLETRSTRERLEKAVACLNESVRQMKFQKRLDAVTAGTFTPEDYRN